MEEYNIGLLCNAVIIQAIVDYRKNKRYRKEVENFFKSDHHYLFSNLDGDVLLNIAKENDRRKRGYVRKNYITINDKGTETKN